MANKAPIVSCDCVSLRQADYSLPLHKWSVYHAAQQIWFRRITVPKPDTVGPHRPHKLPMTAWFVVLRFRTHHRISSPAPCGSLWGNSSPKCGLTLVVPRGDGKLCWPLGRLPAVEGRWGGLQWRKLSPRCNPCLSSWKVTRFTPQSLWEWQVQT